MRLERPRAEIPGDVEAAVDVVEVALGVDRQPERVTENLRVPAAHREDVLRLEELDLVQQLRRVAPHEVQERHRPVAGKFVDARHVETPAQPRGIRDEVLHQHRPALGDRHVAEPARLHQQVGIRVRVVLGVTRLVEERLPVVLAADRLDDEHHTVGNLDRRAERARRLRRTRLEVEVDVLLRAQVDTEVGQRRFERRQHPVLRIELVELRRAEQADDVPRPRLVEADPEPRAEELVALAFPELLGLV